MPRPLRLDRRADWFAEDGLHVLQLDADPACRIADLADALRFEIAWATETERAPARQVLHDLMMQLSRLPAG